MTVNTDALTYVVYSVCAFMTGGLCFIIWHMYSRILRTQDAFIEALNDVRLEQVQQNHEIKSNKEHIIRLERVQTSAHEDLADTIVAKLMFLKG